MKTSGTWIAEKDRTPAWWIWNRLFMCRVTYIHSMSIDYIEKFGMPASGYDEYDKETANELVIRMLSINDMVEFYKNGVTIHVVNYKDTKEIYERISDHLNMWKKQIETSFHTRDAPIDDLLLLDKFASTVYKHAVSQFNTEIIDSLIARRASSVMKVSREKILAPLKPKAINAINDDNKEDIVEENKYPDRISMAESFQRSKPIYNGNKRWK